MWLWMLAWAWALARVSLLVQMWVLRRTQVRSLVRIVRMGRWAARTRALLQVVVVPPAAAMR